jgi:hypothetical protein
MMIFMLNKTQTGLAVKISSTPPGAMGKKKISGQMTFRSNDVSVK